MTAETGSCARLDKCGFFTAYKGNSEVTRAGWITMFCKNAAKCGDCARKRYFAAHGTPPPDNMAPTGRML